MLKHLFIENYALIKTLDLSFDNGFSTLTGETGAGKSIMLGALGLVLGNRSDNKVLFEPDKKCLVEATFQMKGYRLEPLFDQYDLDYDDETIFRREINPGGKSRAFINDTPVTLEILKEIGTRLINIHSQHEILVLNQRDFQMAMLDAFAGIEVQLNEYQIKYAHYRHLNQKLRELKEYHADQLAKNDYHSFLFEELSSAHLESIDLKALEQDAAMLEHAEEIRTNLVSLDQLFQGEPFEFLVSLKGIIHGLAKFQDQQQLVEMIERLETFRIEAEDIHSEIEKLHEKIVADPEKLSMLNEKISAVYHLLQKHRKEDLADLILLREELDEELQQQHDTGIAIENTEKELAEVKILLDKLAFDISEQRKQATPTLIQHLRKLLSRLGMADARMEIDLVQLSEPGSDGIDKVSLLFSANAGVQPDLIRKAASGGELSRLMLAVKSVLSSKKLIPTIIFDEIDAGVSGDIAGKTGTMMKEMGENMQVIAITHLPQIAAKGKKQYLASKIIDHGRTYSVVKMLSPEEREVEIARMLSDEEPTDASKANARQMLNFLPS